MTVIVNPLHWYHRPAHLEHVTREMRRRGAPRIRAYFDGEVWHCKEGTHRLRAALALGVAPIMVPIPWWRGTASLERARFAAIRNGHAFPRVEVGPLWGPALAAVRASKCACAADARERMRCGRDVVDACNCADYPEPERCGCLFCSEVQRGTN